ncbi:DnaJ-domain-containing protein [Clathrospora elynae]|uniref:DnaJ-domain-containing protein n=1 Tax=Clathrospora elynae TaxID=706981 RepID=A0A6A5T1S8_9PLEO|nr:DnaJ-domain-containing protein [Clathrospora elynae]
MGASQSAESGGKAPQGGVEVKKSYYALLDVERNATAEELKRAYRKKALELHPDRNYGDVERTTVLFKEVRSAYEVLSDDQERAWYDTHEGFILRGGPEGEAPEGYYQDNMRVTTAGDLTRMMAKFSRNVEFTDAPDGFFGFVRETFAQLAREEAHAAYYAGIRIPDYPSFGHKDDEYEGAVRAFYMAWNDFQTVKSYAWQEEFKLANAWNRQLRRDWDYWNTRGRQEGRKEFSDAVNTLIAFVRKRDPRYTPKTDEQKAKAQRDARKAQAARARAAHLAKLEQETVPSWATPCPATALEEESEEEVEEVHYECVACNKIFKSERQWEAHERSKKHQKAVESLKRKMQKDNVHLNLDEDAISSGVMTAADDELEAETTADDGVDLGNSVQDLADLKLDDSSSDEHEADPEAPVPEEIVSGPRAVLDYEDDEYPSSSDMEALLAGYAKTPTSVKPNDTAPTNFESEGSQEPRLGKAALKRAKRAAKKHEVDESAPKHKCAGCDVAFPAKNRLHQHLKDFPKHAALKTPGTSRAGKKGTKR